MKKSLILFGLFFILLVVGCEYTKMPSSSKNICEEKAKKLIPDKLILIWNIEGGGPWRPEEFNWKDGTKAGNTPGISYGGSSRAGDNINYYYPNTLYADSSFFNTYLDYSKKIVNDKGIILGNNEFEVELILEPIPNTERIINKDYAFQREKHQDFKVVETRFQSCGWVG